MSVYLQHFAELVQYIPSLVRCEHCGKEYVYEIKFRGTGLGESGLLLGKGRAREEAMAAAKQMLQHKLQKIDACDPVPCPQCLKFQPYMRKTAARRKYNQWPILIGFFICLGVALAGIAILGYTTSDKSDKAISGTVKFSIAPVTSFILGFLLWLLMRKLIKRYDPNKLPARKRQAIADERAMTLERFESVQLDRNRSAYNKYRRSRRDDQEDHQLAFEMNVWERPTLITNGGELALCLPTGEPEFIQLPEDGADGSEYSVTGLDSNETFVVRVWAFRIHPDNEPDDD